MSGTKNKITSNNNGNNIIAGQDTNITDCVNSVICSTGSSNKPSIINKASGSILSGTCNTLANSTTAFGNIVSGMNNLANGCEYSIVSGL